MGLAAADLPPSCVLRFMSAVAEFIGHSFSTEMSGANFGASTAAKRLLVSSAAQNHGENLRGKDAHQRRERKDGRISDGRRLGLAIAGRERQSRRIGHAAREESG